EPKMWRDILLANRQELLQQSKVFKETLAAMEQMIEAGNGEALETLIDQASRTRAHWRMGVRNKP
ncbi:MAG TPA: prephenate dehydrogenase dimerization domain-containing protein, partial [Variovorax sp.]